MLVTLGSHLNQGKKIWRYKKEKDNEIKNKTRYTILHYDHSANVI